MEGMDEVMMKMEWISMVSVLGAEVRRLAVVLSFSLPSGESDSSTLADGRGVGVSSSGGLWTLSGKEEGEDGVELMVKQEEEEEEEEVEVDVEVVVVVVVEDEEEDDVDVGIDDRLRACLIVVMVVEATFCIEFFTFCDGDETQRNTRLPRSSSDAAMVSGLTLRRMERTVSAALLEEGSWLKMECLNEKPMKEEEGMREDAVPLQSI